MQAPIHDRHTSETPKIIVRDSSLGSGVRYGPFCFLTAIWRNRYILGKLVSRDLSQRYRGSILGYAWALLIPLLLLAVFTTIFTVVFEARWSVETGGTKNFALLLFAGLIALNFINECINRSPALLTQNRSLISKVFFPVEVLPVQIVATAMVNLGIGLALLVAATMAVHGMPPATITERRRGRGH